MNAAVVTRAPASRRRRPRSGDLLRYIAYSTGQPRFSRTRAGRSGWFWVLCRSWEGDDVAADGLVTSPTEARQAAVAAAGTPVFEDYSYVAAEIRRKRAVAERLARGSSRTDAQTLEFAWASGLGWGPHQHLIVKRTKRLVFVDRARWTGQPSADPFGRRCLTVDRVRFERGESVMVAPWVWVSANRKDSKNEQGAVPCLEVLGLAPGCTSAEVERAFRRLARKAHPDAGGSAEAFVALSNARDRALSVATAGGAS